MNKYLQDIVVLLIKYFSTKIIPLEIFGGTIFPIYSTVGQEIFLKRFMTALFAIKDIPQKRSFTEVTLHVCTSFHKKCLARKSFCQYICTCASIFWAWKVAHPTVLCYYCTLLILVAMRIRAKDFTDNNVGVYRYPVFLECSFIISFLPSLSSMSFLHSRIGDCLDQFLPSLETLVLSNNSIEELVGVSNEPKWLDTVVPITGFACCISISADRDRSVGIHQDPHPP